MVSLLPGKHADIEGRMRWGSWEKVWAFRKNEGKNQTGFKKGRKKDWTNARFKDFAGGENKKTEFLPIGKVGGGPR